MTPEWLSTYNAALNGLLARQALTLDLREDMSEEAKTSRIKQYQKVVAVYQSSAVMYANSLHGYQRDPEGTSTGASTKTE